MNLLIRIGTLQRDINDLS